MSGPPEARELDSLVLYRRSLPPRQRVDEACVGVKPGATRIHIVRLASLGCISDGLRRSDPVRLVCPQHRRAHRRGI